MRPSFVVVGPFVFALAVIACVGYELTPEANAVQATPTVERMPAPEQRALYDLSRGKFYSTIAVTEWRDTFGRNCTATAYNDAIAVDCDYPR